MRASCLAGMPWRFMSSIVSGVSAIIAYSNNPPGRRSMACTSTWNPGSAVAWARREPETGQYARMCIYINALFSVKDRGV